jgi:hypothetical protein
MKSVKMNFVNYVTRFAIAVVLSGWLVSVAPQASAQAKVVGWTVGNNGTILYSADGTKWVPVETPKVTKVNLNAVASPDGKTAWAVGNAPVDPKDDKKKIGPGTILYFDGKTLNDDKQQVWKQQEKNDKGKPLPPVHFYGVFSLDSTHTWVVGEGGTILYSNGDTGENGWQVQKFPKGVQQVNLYGVFFTKVENRNYGWAVGDNGVIIYYDGAEWVKVTSSPGGTIAFRSISGYGDKKSYYLNAVGDKDRGIWKCQGPPNQNKCLGPQNKDIGWTKLTGKAGNLKDQSNMRVVQVFAGSNKWIGQIGVDENVYQGNGADWFPRSTGTFKDVYGLSLSPDGNSAWAVGQGGNIAYSGKPDKKGEFKWTVVNPAPKEQLNGIVIRPAPKQQIKLEQSASPDSGIAGVNYVSVSGSDFPDGDINANNVTVVLATECHGTASASTSAVSIVSGSGDSQLVSFLLPAGLDPGQYFISISDSEEGDANFESSNCSEVNVVQ